MSKLKLKLEGNVRAASTHELDQLAAAMRDVVRARADIENAHVSVDADEAAITMVITAGRWADAAKIGSDVIGEAIRKIGLEYIAEPEDYAPIAPGTVVDDGARLTLT